MRYIGLDLAWGERARTGIASLDEDGRLVTCASVRSDDEIVDFAGEHAPRDCVLAIDAPLIVPNESGQRVAERLVAERFGRFAAGAYPANRSNALFNPMPRALRLAGRLGCEPDPAVAAGPGRRVAIEVYPHSASVVLFSLSRRLPYKGKHGRPLEVRATAFAQLIDFIETTLGSRLRPADCQRWREIAKLARTVARPADIERIEDEADAVICGYLAWLWHTDPLSCWVLGDVTTGYVVTPILPGWVPTSGRAGQELGEPTKRCPS